jgi:uncharacterized membrane protein
VIGATYQRRSPALFSKNERLTTQKESRFRSILKGLTWRILATSTIILIVYFKTGNIQGALEIGAIEFIIKFLLYYMHERAWQLIPRGSIRKLLKMKKEQ